jgi:hypothetical protein
MSEKCLLFLSIRETARDFFFVVPSRVSDLRLLGEEFVTEAARNALYNVILNPTQLREKQGTLHWPISYRRLISNSWFVAFGAEFGSALCWDTRMQWAIFV